MKPAQLYPNRDKGVIVPLSIVGLNPKADVLGKPWLRRTEFHVTALIPRKIIPRLVAEAGLPEDTARNLLWDTIDKVSQDVRIGDSSFTGELGLAHEGDKDSIFAMCDTPGIADLIKGMNDDLPVELEHPPTHVTLYTLTPGIGIGMATKEEKRELSRPLTEAEAAEFYRAADPQGVLR